MTFHTRLYYLAQTNQTKRNTKKKKNRSFCIKDISGAREHNNSEINNVGENLSILIRIHAGSEQTFRNFYAGGEDRSIKCEN